MTLDQFGGKPEYHDHVIVHDTQHTYLRCVSECVLARILSRPVPKPLYVTRDGALNWNKGINRNLTWC